MVLHSQNSLKNQTIFLFFGKSISLVFQLLIPIILVRIFDKSDYGIYQNILMIIGLTGALISWNLSSSIYYFYQRAENRNALLTNTLLLQAVIVLLFSVLYVLFRNQIINFFAIDNNPGIAFIIGFSVIFSINTDLIESILVAERQAIVTFLYMTFSGLLKLLLLCIAGIMTSDIYIVINCLLLFYAIQTAFSLFYIFINYDIKIKNIEKSSLIEQIKYIFPLGLSKFTGEIANRIDKVIFAHHFTKADFAVYSVASFRIPFVNLLFPSISNVIIPQISLYAKENNLEGARILWHKMIFVFALITIPFTVFSFFTAGELINFLFTEQYSSAVPVYRFILLTFLIQIFARGTIINAFGKTSYILKIQLISSIAGIILSPVLIKNFGMWGAAFSFVFIFYMNGLLQVFTSRNILKLSFKKWLPWSGLLSIIVISLVPAALILPFKIFLQSNIIILAFSFLVYSLSVIILYKYQNIIKISVSIQKWPFVRMDLLSSGYIN